MTKSAADRFVPFEPRRISRAVHAVDPPDPSPATGLQRVDSDMPAPASDAVASENETAVAPHHFDDATSNEGMCRSSACAAELRALATRLAADACARALRAAVARNPLFVARFVDDALQALGRTEGAHARLHPADAAACAGRVRCDVVADGTLSRGEVVLEAHGSAGKVRASIDERAQLFVRAAADG